MNGFHDAAQPSEDALGTHGRIRRHRIFRVLGINFSYHVQHQRDDFTLEGRISKDQFNHPNGDYTVIQHAGGGYNTVLYSASGARIRQNTYNSEGELLQSLGESSSGTLRKRMVLMPSDALSYQKASNRERTKEDHAIRKLAGSAYGDDLYESFDLG